MTSSPPPRLAASVLLLRDTPAGLEVLMVRRHHEIDFSGGALVFPGGKLATGDYDPRVPGLCSGVEGLSSEQIALRVSAMREAFEESGLLLARARGAATLLGPARTTELGHRYRRPLDSGELGIADMLEAEDLVLACEGLVPFSHWITPAYVPKRFDTHFFLARAPDEQVAVHDGKEMVDSLWLRPADAIAARESGEHKIVTATFFNLRQLDESKSVAAAFEAARRRRIVTVLPKVVERPTGKVLLIPAEAGYGVSEWPATGG